MIRIAATLISALVLLCCAAAAFWYQDLQYARPTPRPAGLTQIPPGNQPDIIGLIPVSASKPKARLLHFFNPHCPCSRFNLDHLRYLVQHYSPQVQFVAVLQVEKDEYADALEEFRDLDLNIPVVIDTAGLIAERCGVYSTPQAVVLDDNFQLYYRGNYNKSRYCTDASTDFARIALDSVLKGAEPPVFEQKEATVSYGCELPANLVQAQAIH
jgi:hypothetical protein